MKKRITSVILALCIVLALTPVTAFAARADAFEDAEDYTFGTTVNDKLDTKYSITAYAQAYKFSIQKSGAVQLSFEAKNTDHIVCGFFGCTDKKQVWSHSEYNPVLGGGMGKDVAPVNETIHLTGGDYYFAVESYHDIGYTFTMTYTSVDESFPETGWGTNNAKDTATEIELNVAYRGQIAKNDSEDYYKFTVPADGPVTLNVTSEIYRVTNGQRRYIGPGSIYKDGYSQAISFRCDDQANGQNGVFRGTVDLKAGNYYYRMGDTSGDKPCGNYTFRLSYNGGPTEHTITFDANGGTLLTGGTTATMLTGIDGKLQAEPPEVAERTGYTFQGWYTADGTVVNQNRVFTKGTIAYARWLKDGETPTYTVTFYWDERDGAEIYDTKTVKADQTIDWPDNPEREGHTFQGWFADDNTEYKEGAAFTNSMNLYARWKEDPKVPDPPKTFTITLDANGGTLSGASTVATGTDGKLSAMPADPKREGYTFNGWYIEETSDEMVSTSTVFNADTTIYAQWTANSTTPPSDEDEYRIYAPGSVSGGRVYVSHSTAAPGTRITIELRPWSDYELDWISVVNLDTDRELRLTERYSDEYTFIMPSSDVEVDVSYTDRYYYGSSWTYYVREETPADPRPVKWYYSNGSIYHVTDGLAPYGGQLTRDMLLSVLYNMDPASTGDPTIWAASHGIIPDIYISELWGVDKPINREQTAMILYCYSQHMGYSTAQSTSLTGYADYRQISDAARPAVSWARGAGLIAGTSANTLSPRAVLTCGQAGAVLSRFAASVARTW